MPIMEISVIPVGTKSTSISKYVAKSDLVLKKARAKSQVTAMGTIVESGSLDKLFKLAEKMHKTAFNSGVKRVVTSITIDDRKDKKATIESKVESVRKRLGL
ncbi:MAG: MTH1187 family thiamine-binding protein [Candidatus Omnitrophica bacterium]|nr:MTH1187 family thiamine-binding protein [Candidatus Omnitrophota bacterium]